MIRLKPKVTVLAPVFNGEKYICGFIESILRQDYDNWELILIDDGSADSTVQLVRQYVHNMRRLLAAVLKFVKHCDYAECPRRQWHMCQLV